MSPAIRVKRTNTILYCQRWAEMVQFYHEKLALPIMVEQDWFIEFQLAPNSFLSIAQAERSTIQSSKGQGITITCEVDDIQAAWQTCQALGLQPRPVKHHSWGALQFFLFDPEGYRLEIWQKS